MKKFTINCDFGGQMAPFSIYIGVPEKSHHPLHFQADWLSKERGGTIPAEIMDAIAKLKDLAEKNNVSLEELCVYSLGSAQQEESDQSDVAEVEASQDDASAEDSSTEQTDNSDSTSSDANQSDKV
jgi:hypothetical protein